VDEMELAVVAQQEQGEHEERDYKKAKPEVRDWLSSPGGLRWRRSPAAVGG
jgi:hypothetical protein